MYHQDDFPGTGKFTGSENAPWPAPGHTATNLENIFCVFGKACRKGAFPQKIIIFRLFFRFFCLQLCAVAFFDVYVFVLFFDEVDG